jgi:hypothetical protein
MVPYNFDKTSHKQAFFLCGEFVQQFWKKLKKQYFGFSYMTDIKTT